MSLIRRCQLTNFLDSTGEDGWNPSFDDVTLNFHCNSSAIVGENGLGKTLTIKAILALLSRDKEFITKTKELLPPPKVGIPGHIRIEFLTESPGEGDLFLYDQQSGVSGEGFVVGMYGYKGGDLKFYHYLGGLEDVPVVKDAENGRRRLVPVDEFREYLDDADGEHDVSWSDWIQIISEEVVPRSQIMQMVRFQKAGGHDNSSRMFPVNMKGEDSYDQAFFYQILAPELLSDFFVDGKSFVDGMIGTATQLAAIQRRIKENLKKSDKLTDTLRALKPAIDTAKQISKIKQEKESLQKQIVQGAATIDFIESAEIPGLPAKIINPLTPEIESLIKHMAIIPGKGVQLMDRGLAELLGKQVEHVNRDSSSKNFSGTKSAQPIEIALDLIRSQHEKRGWQGHSNQFYDLPSTLQFIQRSSDEYLKGRDREKLKNRLKEVFKIAESVDTNPYRIEGLKLGSQIVDAQEGFSTTEKSLSESTKKADDGNRQYQVLLRAKEAYQQIDREGLLRAIDLENKISPMDSRQDLCVQQDKLNTDIAKLHKESGSLGKIKDQLDLFFKEYPEQKPRQVHDQLIEDEKQLIQKVKQAKEQCQQLEGKRPALRNKESSLSRDLTQNQTVYDSTKKLEVESRGALDDFPQATTPADLEKILEEKQHVIQGYQKQADSLDKLFSEQGRVVGEVDNLKRKIENISQKLTECEAQHKFILDFERTHPGITPEDFLDSVKQETFDLKLQKKKLEASQQQKTDELRELENKKPAASPETTKAWSDIIPESAEKLFEVVQLVNPADKDLLLKKFASLLFCPVIEEISVATKTVQLLLEQDISLPVFLKKDFVAGLQSGKTDGLLMSSMVGFESETVRLLLYPNLIEEKKKKVQGQIESIGNQIQNVIKQIQDLSPGQPEHRLATSANEAIIKGIPQQVKDCQGKLEELQRSLQEQSSLLTKVQTEIDTYWCQVKSIIPDAGIATALKPSKGSLETVKKYIQQYRNDFNQKYGKNPVFKQKFDNFKHFFKVGGPNALAELQTDLERLKKEYGQAKSQLDDFENQCEKLRKKYQSVDDECRGIKTKLSQFEFEPMIAVDESGGLQRYESLQKQITEGEAKRTRIQQQLADLPFKEAQQYHEQKGLFKELKACLPELREQIEVLSNEKKRLEALLTDLNEKQQQIIQQAKELDVVIFALSKIIQSRKQLNVNIEPDVQIDPDIQNIINEILQGLEVIGNTEYLTNSLAQTEFDKLRKELEAKDAAIGREKTYYSNHVDTVLQKEKTGLSDMEKETVAGTKQNPDLIGIFVNKVQETVISTKEETLVFKGDVEGQEKMAKKMLIEAANRDARSRLNAFKNICKKYNDKATFHVKADVAKPEHIDIAMKNVRKRVEEWIDGHTKGAFNKEDVKMGIKKDSKTVQEITNDLYRGIFKNTSILAEHPDIRSGNKIPFSQSSKNNKNDDTGDLSEGQMVVLELMMLIRMAEYSAKSEGRSISKTFFIIDGLFSSVSKDKLLKSSLSALKENRGSFQLIGFLHNKNYVNNPELFPTELIARERKGFDPTKEGMESTWVEFDEKTHTQKGIGIAEVTLSNKKVIA